MKLIEKVKTLVDSSKGQQLFRLVTQSGQSVRTKIYAVENDYLVIKGTDRPDPDMMIPFTSIDSIEPVDSL
jgi:hypothetical protein